jgi:hypothetical protein
MNLLFVGGEKGVFWRVVEWAAAVMAMIDTQIP